MLDINGGPPPVPDFPYSLAASVAPSYIEPKKKLVDSGTQVCQYVPFMMCIACLQNVMIVHFNISRNHPYSVKPLLLSETTPT